MKKVVQAPLKNGPKIINNHKKIIQTRMQKQNTKHNMIFIKKVLQNGAKSGPLESKITLG